MSSDDRLLEALQRGGERCPDGRALARLGDLVRNESRLPQAPDLVARVLSACADPMALAAVDDDEDSLVDALYDGDDQDVKDTRLIRMREIVRQASRLEREPDLLPQLSEALAEASTSGRRRVERQIDSDLRWRIWSVVVGGHVAALLALALLNIDFSGDPDGPESVLAEVQDQAPGDYEMNPDRLRKLIARADGDAVTASTQLPSAWSDLRSHPRELYRLRQTEDLRSYAREVYGCQDTTLTVDRGLRWLELQQDGSGFFGTASGNAFVDLAAQGMATLALLGQGVDEQHRSKAIRAALTWLRGRQDANGSFGEGAKDEMVYGVLALALTEGAVLLEDDGFRNAAEAAFTSHAHALIRHGGGGGLNGFALLAIDTASLNGFSLPPGLTESGETFLARPVNDRDAGTIGLSLLGNAIRGRHDPATIAQEVHAILATIDPQSTVCDPLGWYFASLALRDADRQAWIIWNTMLKDRILHVTEYGDAGARVVADQIRYAEEAGRAGDVLATSISLLNLQVCYRYLPIRMR